MPTDRSTTDSSAGVNNASGTNNAVPKDAPSASPLGTRKPKILARRRLKESDVTADLAKIAGEIKELLTGFPMPGWAAES